MKTADAVKNMKDGLQRELFITRKSDNVTNSKFVDKSGMMVGIKKAGQPVLADDFITSMENRGLVASWSDNYRRG